MRNFFSTTEGINMTSASHVAELARQKARTASRILENPSFIDETMTVIGSDTESPVSYGLKDTDIEKIYDALQVKIQCNSLTAYLMEAVKEKEKALNDAKNWHNNEARVALEQERRKLRPTRQFPLTEEKVLETWPIGQLQKYLSLQAKVSVLGKFIHEDAPLDGARKKVIFALNNPLGVVESGRDTIIHKRVPSLSLEEIDKMYFNLQSSHRADQAEFNSMKKLIQDTIEADTRAKDAQYDKEYREYLEADREYNRLLEEIELDEVKRRESMIDEISKLKIVIPDNLQAIYKRVTE